MSLLTHIIGLQCSRFLKTRGISNELEYSKFLCFPRYSRIFLKNHEAFPWGGFTVVRMISALDENNIFYEKFKKNFNSKETKVVREWNANFQEMNSKFL